MKGISKVAKRRETLAFYTAIMRGEIKDYALRKVDGTDEVVALPPKVIDRMKSAEVLLDHLPEDAAAAPDPVDAVIARAMGQDA